MTEHLSRKPDHSLLARGGGNATAAGVSFQATLGAALASHALADRRLDSSLELTNAGIRSLRFETEAPIDDILVETVGDGFIFVQAKTSLVLSTKPGSELGKTAEQIVRQLQACATGDGKRGWDRPLSSERDALVIAVGPTASGTIRNDLATALARLRRPPAPADLVPRSQREALTDFANVLEQAWQRVTENPAPAGEIDRLLPFIRVMCCDLDGPDRALAIEILRHCLADGDAADAAFSALAVVCEGHMAARTGDDAAGFRRALAAEGIRFDAPPDYRADVDALRRASERTRDVLALHRKISVSGEDFAIDRQCTKTVLAAAQADSLLLIGEPGSGKSAVLNTAANELRQAGYPVVELAVDHLPIQGLDGLRAELGLRHPVRDVLANWPGIEPAFLVIDALDASRGNASEAVFRQLITEALALPRRRWRVLASIRSFDLSLGRQFRMLFQGTPPDPACADPAFPSVRHIHVPPWTEIELAALLKRAPALEAALAAGGERVRDLARVPFNTRLLAELITGGLAPEALRALSSQADLLQLYWENRVLIHGAGAEICLRAVVDEMIAAHGLRASYQTGGRANSVAFEQLLRTAVLVAQDGNRHVAFRHHILFDYAASRLFLNPHDVDALRTVLGRDRGLGLLLAPALAYAIQELWTSSDAARSSCWPTLATLLSDEAFDPIARSVAARSACELARAAADVDGLLPHLNQARFRAVMSHLLGALAIRLEDAASATPFQPWMRLAEAAGSIPGLEESVRFLLWLLTKHPDAPQHHSDLGRAARQLLQAAFSRTEADYSPNLTIAAIEFVANTYASDPTASRALLERVFEPARFDLHAHQEVPWLADGIKGIAPLDPEFAGFIYRQTFAREVTSTAPTPMGDSQILSLTSNARQDYQMARHRLKEYFPRFLAEHPDAAAEAMLTALEGYVAAEHPIADENTAWTITLSDGSAASLQEDASHVWAWDPDSNHPDDAEHLLNAFILHLREAPDAEAVRVAGRIMGRNRLALVWARLLMVAAARSGVLTDLLWPVATQEAFLLCQDTRKDAIDFIVAAYPARSPEERSAFERTAQHLDWSFFRDPALARQHVLSLLFGSIGADHLASDSARQFVEAQAPGGVPSNERPFTITSNSGAPEKWWWLRSAGVDLQDPLNTTLLEHAERVEAALGLRGEETQTQIDDMRAAIAQLQELERAMDQANKDGAPLDILRVPGGVLARGCAAIASASPERLAGQDDVLAAVVAMTVRLAAHRHPEADPEEEARFDRSPSWGSPAPRIDAAGTIMQLCRRQDPPDPVLPRTVETLVRDPHPAVRLMVVQQLTVLWNIDRTLLWELAEAVAREEMNRSVIRGFISGVLGPARNADPARVEQHVLTLRERFAQDAREDEPRRDLRRDIGCLIALLWVGNERQQARAIIADWCDRPLDHETELAGVLSTIRSSLVFGYGTDAPADGAIRKRGQDVIALAVETAARELEAFYGADREAQALQAEGARKQARLLDHACNELYFASGAFKRSDQDEDRGLQTLGQKRTFLVEVEPTLRRIGDVGTPHTIHHLLELLEFLVPADPGRVFDLMAHALLEGGKRQGYQFESLGSKVFVELVGVFLADHRELFEDEKRRRRLVDCLDVFIEAGWPAARRLLYQLPELLR